MVVLVHDERVRRGLCPFEDIGNDQIRLER